MHTWLNKSRAEQSSTHRRARLAHRHGGLECSLVAASSDDGQRVRWRRLVYNQMASLPPSQCLAVCHARSGAAGRYSLKQRAGADWEEGAPASIHQHPPPPRSDRPGLSCYRGGTLHPGRNDSAGGPHQFSAPSRHRDACRVSAPGHGRRSYLGRDAHCALRLITHTASSNSGRTRLTTATRNASDSVVQQRRSSRAATP
jgi:hypothetical protein